MVSYGPGDRAQVPWELELREGSSRLGCHACPSLPCSPGPHPAEPEPPVGPPGRRHPAHHPRTAPPDRRQHQCLCRQPALPYVSSPFSLVPAWLLFAGGCPCGSQGPLVHSEGGEHRAPGGRVKVQEKWLLCLLVVVSVLIGGRQVGSLGWLGQGEATRPHPTCRQEPVCPEAIVCHTMPQANPGEAVVRVVFGHAQRTLLTSPFRYTANPQLVVAEPSVSFRG